MVRGYIDTYVPESESKSFQLGTPCIWAEYVHTVVKHSFIHASIGADSQDDTPLRTLQ